MRRRTLWTVISLAACAALVGFQLQGLAIAAAIAKLTASTAFIVVAVSAGARALPGCCRPVHWLSTSRIWAPPHGSSCSPRSPRRARHERYLRRV